MKKFAAFLVVLTLSLSAFSVPDAEAKPANERILNFTVDSNIYYVDDVKYNFGANEKVVPLIKNGSVYVPARTIPNWFGTPNSYNSGQFRIVAKNRTTIFDTHKKKIYINGRQFTTLQSFIFEGKLYLPIGRVANAVEQPLVRDGNAITIGHTK
jgi:Copper amine oxidase N-terminal domain